MSQPTAGETSPVLGGHLKVLPSNVFGTNERHDIFILGKLGSAYFKTLNKILWIRFKIGDLGER